MAKKQAVDDGLTDEERQLDQQMQEDEQIVVLEEGEEAEQQPEAEKEAPEQEPPAEEARPEEERKPTTVPLQALDAERHKRRGVEDQLRELQDQLQQYIGEGQKPQGEEKSEPAPDPVTHPDEFKAWLGKQFEARQQPVAEFREHLDRAMQQQRATQELQGYARQGETVFRHEHSDRDYDGALRFARERRAEELKLWGYGEHEIPQLIAQTEAAVTAQARQRGVNPAAYIYNYAVMSGFKDGAQQPDADKVARLGEAQRQTQSAANAGGAPRQEEYTLERLEKMSDEEIANLPEDVWRKVMGG